MKSLIREEVGAHKASFIDATDLANRLLGDSIAGNMFLLGYALQSGYVPVSRQALERAIELNGVAVEFNLQAFEWGRRAAVDPGEVEKTAGVKLEFEPLTNLDDIVADRVARLTDYQSRAYATKYEDAISRIGGVEREKSLEKGFEFTKAAARSLYKLMAYKDEYEVARLFANDDFSKHVNDLFAGDYRLNFHLAPPVFAKKEKKTGRPGKRKFPGLTMWAFRMLAPFRFLRGTRLDAFGYQSERVEERQTLADFEALFVETASQLREDNYEVAVEIARLPMKIRGYGHVKSANLADVNIKKRMLLEQLEGKRFPIVTVVDATA